MPKIILICFALILYSCVNKKAEIVEEIKKHRDSIAFVQRDISIIKMRHREVLDQYEKTGTWNKPVKDSVFDAAGKADQELFRLNQKIRNLELELKKY